MTEEMLTLGKGELMSVEFYTTEEFNDEARLDDGFGDFFFAEGYMPFETVEEMIKFTLEDNEITDTVYVRVDCHRWGECYLDDGYLRVEEYGDTCLGGQDYIWNGYSLD